MLGASAIPRDRGLVFKSGSEEPHLDIALPPAKWPASGQASAQHIIARPGRRAARPGHRNRADGRRAVPSSAWAQTPPTATRQRRQGRAPPTPSPLLCPRRPARNDEPPTAAPCRAFRSPLAADAYGERKLRGREPASCSPGRSPPRRAPPPPPPRCVTSASWPGDQDVPSRLSLHVSSIHHSGLDERLRPIFVWFFLKRLK
jgi:hypothetical protein